MEFAWWALKALLFLGFYFAIASLVIRHWLAD